MSTQTDRKTEKQVEREIAESKEQIATLTAQLREVKARKTKLQKAHRMLTGQPHQESNDRINATLKHISKAITVSFGTQSLMQADELGTRVLQVLRAHGSFSERGLKRRVEQGLNRLTKDSAGLLLRPESNPQSTTKDNNSSSPTG